MNSCVGYQHISRFSNIAGANGSSPCFFIGCFVILCNCCPVCLVVQVCSDVPGIDISLAFQLGIRVSASLIDCIGNRRIDSITGDKIGIALGYRTLVVGRYFIGNSTRLFIRGMGNCHTVTLLNFDCIFSKVLDDRLAIIRNILEILQIGDIRGIRAYLGIKSSQVGSRGIGRFHIHAILGRTYFIIDCLACYHLIAVRSNGAIADGRGPVFCIGLLLVFRTGQVLPNIGRIHIGFHAIQFLQLGHVDRIGLVCTGSHTVDLTGYTAVCLTDGYGSIGGLPDCRGICGSSTGSRIIPGNFISFYRGFRPAADGHAACCTDFCVMTNGDYVRNGGGIPLISGTQDEVVLCIRQGMVVPKDDIGLVLVGAFTGYSVVSPDQVVILAVFQFRIETFNIVQLGRSSIAIILSFVTAAGNRVAHTVDLSHIGIINSVATAHDHNLAAAAGNGILQGFCHFFGIAETVIDGIHFRSINLSIGIGYRVPGAVDNGRVGIRGDIRLADDAVGGTAEFFRILSIMVDVEGTIGQSSCTFEKSVTIINDAGIGTGYRGSQASRIGICTGSQAASASGSCIASIAEGIAKAKAGHIVTIDRVILDIVGLIVQGIRIGFHLAIKSGQVVSSGLGFLHIRSIIWTDFAVHCLARYQLFAVRSNGTGTDSLAPLVFISLDIVGRSSSGSIRSFQICPDIARIFLGILFQLFHHHYIMVILAFSHFHQTVVGSIRILGFRYRFWSLGIVILCTIRIGLAIGPLFPCYCISGYVTGIMAEGNCPGFIGGSLIADSSAIFRGYHCLMTSSQSACCVLASRTASNADRIVAIYSAVIRHCTVIGIVFSA